MNKMLQISVKGLIYIIVVLILIAATAFYSFKYYEIKPVADKAIAQDKAVGEFISQVARVQSMADLQKILIAYGVLKVKQPPEQTEKK